MFVCIEFYVMQMICLSNLIGIKKNIKNFFEFKFKV